MKKVIALILALSAATAGYIKITDLEKREEAALKELHFLTGEQVTTEFKITERDASTLSLQMRFLNPEGKPVGNQISYTLKGSTLYIEYFIIRLTDTSYWHFPVKIYSDTIPPGKGLLLTDFYTSEGFPLIHESRGEEIPLKTLMKLVHRGLDGERKHGFFSAVHDTQKNPFMLNRTYRITGRNQGGLEVGLR